MSDAWLTIKVWAKGIVFGAVLLYSALFVYNNSGHDGVHFWWWFGHDKTTTSFLLIATSFVTGAACMFFVETLVRTAWKLRAAGTVRRQLQLEREVAEMKAKAAMLQPAAVEVRP